MALFPEFDVVVVRSATLISGKENEGIIPF